MRPFTWRLFHLVVPPTGPAGGSIDVATSLNQKVERMGRNFALGVVISLLMFGWSVSAAQ